MVSMMESLCPDSSAPSENELKKNSDDDVGYQTNRISVLESFIELGWTQIWTRFFLQIFSIIDDFSQFVTTYEKSSKNIKKSHVQIPFKPFLGSGFGYVNRLYHKYLKLEFSI